MGRPPRHPTASRADDQDQEELRRLEDVFDHLGKVAPMVSRVRQVIPMTVPSRRGGILMPKVIYAMGGVSADGYIVGPDGTSDWSMPDEGATPISQRADARARRPPV